MRRNPREILLPLTVLMPYSSFFCKWSLLLWLTHPSSLKKRLWLVLGNNHKESVHSNRKRRAAGFFLLSYRRERLDQESDEQNFDQVYDNRFGCDFFLFKQNLRRTFCPYDPIAIILLCGISILWKLLKTIKLCPYQWSWSPVDLKRARTWGEGPWPFDRAKFGTSCCEGRRVTKKRALSFSLSSRTFTLVLKSALSHALIWVTNESKILGDMAGICVSFIQDACIQNWYQLPFSE